MRWRSLLYVFLVEVIAGAFAAAVGFLTNLLANEKHPATVLIVAVVTFIVSSATFQAPRHAIEDRKRRFVDRTLKGVEETTQAILRNQQEADRYRTASRIDEGLVRLPVIYRSWIKSQWGEDPEEIEQVLDALNESTTTPPTVVAEWQQRKPDWFNGLRWRALLVAAELANAYGAIQLSADLFFAAIAAGSTREQYWTARAALLLKFQEQTQTASQTLANGGVDSNSQDRFARIVFYFVTEDRQTAQTLLASWAPEALLAILLTASMHVARILAAADSTTVP